MSLLLLACTCAEPPPPPPPDLGHYDDAEALREAVERGDLEAGRRVAAALTGGPFPAALAEREEDLGVALAFAAIAEDREDLAFGAARAAQACGDCHRAAAHPLPLPTEAPVGHAAAARRMWEALLAPSETAFPVARGAFDKGLPLPEDPVEALSTALGSCVGCHPGGRFDAGPATP